MTDDALWLDGNGLAGLLADVFGAEMTTALRRCPSCGTRSAVGAHRAYRGAGTALRCPACDAVAVRIAVLPDRHIVHVSGTWLMQLPRPGGSPRGG